MEAIWMNKRNGKYYVSYHTHYEKPIDPENPDDPNRLKSRLDYSIGDSPLGPFKYMGIMNYELGVNVKNGPKLPGKDYVPWRLFQSNHGGIVEFHGQEYLFYHTSALSSWRQDEFKGPGTWTQRSVCVDKLNYNPDGTIIPVQQTLEGVPEVKIDQPYDIILQEKNIRVSDENNVLEFKKINLGTGYYYFGLMADNISERINAKIYLDKPDGLLIGTAVIKSNGIAETLLRNAKGSRTVYIVFEGKLQSGINVSELRFFAGSPRK